MLGTYGAGLLRRPSLRSSKAASMSAHALTARVLLSSTRAGHERLRCIARFCCLRSLRPLKKPTAPTSSAHKNVPKIKSDTSDGTTFSTHCGSGSRGAVLAAVGVPTYA
jgi:hypothetical protein